MVGISTPATVRDTKKEPSFRRADRAPGRGRAGEVQPPSVFLTGCFCFRTGTFPGRSRSPNCFSSIHFLGGGRVGDVFRCIGQSRPEPILTSRRTATSPLHRDVPLARHEIRLFHRRTTTALCPSAATRRSPALT